MFNNRFYPQNNADYMQRLSMLEQQYYQQPQMQMQPQPQMQPIQNVSQYQTPPQASCYFVSSPDEIASTNLMPNNFYLGINQNTKEIYVKKMDNNGLIQLETYKMASNVEEKTDYKLILEQLTEINQKLGREARYDESRDVKQSTGSSNERKPTRASSNEPF